MNASERFERSAPSSCHLPAREWFFIDTGQNTGKFNMKFDLGLVEEFMITGVPVLRFYDWDPYCISLGKNQVESDIDAELAARDGVDLVKRPTGGKAVLHAEELTYSVVMETGGISVRESYNRISTALVRGLRKLVPDLELSQSSADFQKLFRDPTTIPCFSTSAVYEVEYHGRKLIGSAQHRFGSVLLQHGSILIGGHHKRIVDYLKVGDEAKRRTRSDLESHTVSLSEILHEKPGRTEMIGAIRRGFESVLGAEFSDPSGRKHEFRIESADSRSRTNRGG